MPLQYVFNPKNGQINPASATTAADPTLREIWTSELTGMKEYAISQAWARAFDEWLAERLLARDWPALCDWPSAPGARESVPTADHLVPLFVAMGASQPGEALSFPVTGFEFGSFSHRSVQFGTSTIGR